MPGRRINLEEAQFGPFNQNPEVCPKMATAANVKGNKKHTSMIHFQMLPENCNSGLEGEWKPNNFNMVQSHLDKDVALFITEMAHKYQWTFCDEPWIPIPIVQDHFLGPLLDNFNEREMKKIQNILIFKKFHLRFLSQYPKSVRFRYRSKFEFSALLLSLSFLFSKESTLNECRTFSELALDMRFFMKVKVRFKNTGETMFLVAKYL